MAATKKKKRNIKMEYILTAPIYNVDAKANTAT